VSINYDRDIALAVSEVCLDWPVQLNGELVGTGTANHGPQQSSPPSRHSGIGQNSSSAHSLPMYVLKIHFNILHPCLGLLQVFFQFAPPKPSLHVFFTIHKVFRETLFRSDFNKVYRIGRKGHKKTATENNIVPFTNGIIPNKLHKSIKLLNLCPALYMLMQQ
jgi:hypothetical protein